MKKSYNEMTMKELSEIAKNLNITLSYKDENGKRQRFNKNELISKIESISKIKVNSDKNKLVTTTVDNELENNVNTENEIPNYNLNNVVNVCKKLINNNKSLIVKKIIEKLINDINKERKNKLLVRQMSMKVEILKHLVHSVKENKLSHA